MNRCELIRTDGLFYEDLRQIKETRRLNKMKKLSDRKILELVRRHNYWKPMMEDIINYEGE